MIKVKVNLTNTVTNCRCGNLFSHWKKFGHQEIRMCPAKGCKSLDIEGIHVQKADPNDSKIYIIPLCSEHAKSKEVIEILPSLNFVNSILEKTCGSGGATVVVGGVI